MKQYFLLITLLALLIPNLTYSQYSDDVLTIVWNAYLEKNYSYCIDQADNYLGMHHDYLIRPNGLKAVNWTYIKVQGFKGLSLFEIGRIDEAIINLKEVDKSITSYSKQGSYPHIYPYELDSNKSEIAWFRGMLGWYLITKGNFKEAEDYCQFAYRTDPNNLAYTLNWAHYLFLTDNIQAGRRVYQQTLILIKDTLTFAINVKSDFEYFLSKKWKPELFMQQLAIMEQGFESRHKTWNPLQPSIFQICDVSHLNSIISDSHPLSTEELSRLFHYLTKYRYYDYESAAMEDGKVNQFKIRRLKAEHNALLGNSKDVGGIYSNRFVASTSFVLQTDDYSFDTKSFDLNVLPLFEKKIETKINHYQDSSRQKGLGIDVAISYDIPELPKIVSVIMLNDTLAEEFSQSESKLSVFFELPDQNIPKPIRSIEPNSFFESYLLTKGINNYSLLPKQKLKVLEMEFLRNYPMIGTTFYQTNNHRIFLKVNLIQITLPNGQLISWLPQNN